MQNHKITFMQKHKYTSDVQKGSVIEKPLLCLFLFCWQSMTVARPNMDCFVFVAVPPPKLSPRFSLSYCYLLEWRCQNIKNTKILTFLTEDVPLEMSANAHFSAKHTRQRDDGGGHHRQKDLHFHHHHCHRDVTFSVCSISHGTCHSVGQTQVREREMSTACCDKSTNHFGNKSNFAPMTNPGDDQRSRDMLPLRWLKRNWWAPRLSERGTQRRRIHRWPQPQSECKRGGVEGELTKDNNKC